MNVDVILIAVLAAGVLALLYAFIKTSWIGRQNVSNAALKEIGKHIADGAMAFLKREYMTLLPFILVVAALLAIFNTGILRFQSLAFLLGAGCSMLAGYIGMKVATKANSRTAEAARSVPNPSIRNPDVRTRNSDAAG